MNDRDETCEAIQELLEPYALGFLAEGGRRRCEEHLRSCDACRRLLAEVRDTVRLLESLPGEAGPIAGLEDRILSLAAADGPLPSRRWSWVGRAAMAAGWLIAVGLGASAVTAAYLRSADRGDAIHGLSTRLEAQESRMALLEGSRVEDRTAVRDAVAAELTGRLEGLRSEVGSLRAEAGRLAGGISRLEPLHEEASTLSKDLDECRAQGARLESALGELATRLEATATAMEARDRAFADLAARVAAREAPTDGLALPSPPASGGPSAVGPVAQAPRASTAPAGAEGAHDGGISPGQTLARTPWDAAFKMASGVVRGRGRDVGERIADYQDDLFRIYTAKD